MRSSDGIVVPMPCGRMDCPWCCKRKDWESAEMVCLDALDGNAPTVWLCLGTREVDVDARRFARAREHVVRALRRRWPDCEYYGRREWTTGYGAHSGGQRRPHFHLLFKGIPREDADQAFDVAARVWCQHVDAEVDAQRGGEIHAPGGLIRYITAHHAKESQKPPRGWTGKREVRSLGYFDSPVDELRARARESIARRRITYRLRRRGLAGVELALEVGLEMLARERRSWAYYVGDVGEASYFLWERDRVEAKLGGWRAAPEMRVFRPTETLAPPRAGPETAIVRLF